MILPLLLSFLIPLVTGTIFISLLWPSGEPLRSHLLLKASLGLGLGFGIYSCIFFLWLIVFGPSSGSLLIIELLICLIAILLYTIKTRHHSAFSKRNSEAIPKSEIHQILPIVFYVALTGAIVSFILMVLNEPHGTFDAWGIWNLRAKFVFRGGDQWTDAFNPIFWATDYPLLVPLTIVRSWKYIGNDTVVVPALVTLFFTFATVGLMFSALSILRSKSQGYLAGTFLLGTPFLLIHGASQHVDVPLGFFFLATIILFCLQNRISGSNFNLLILAGVTAGFSAWTKNEGLLFLVAITVASFTVIVFSKELKTYLKQMFFFSIGFIPVIIIITYFKMHIAPTNHSTFALSNQDFQSMVNSLLDSSRYFQIIRAYIKGIIILGGWWVPFWSINPIFLLTIYLLFFRFKAEEKDKSIIAISIIALCLMLVGYFFVFQASNLTLTKAANIDNLEWYLKGTLDRLFLQLYPSFLFIFFLAIRTLEQSLMIEKTRQGTYATTT